MFGEDVGAQRMVIGFKQYTPIAFGTACRTPFEARVARSGDSSSALGTWASCNVVSKVGSVWVNVTAILLTRGKTCSPRTMRFSITLTASTPQPGDGDPPWSPTSSSGGGPPDGSALEQEQRFGRGRVP